MEIEPFGTTRPHRKDGVSSPQNDLSLPEDGAYVEFDVPEGVEILIYSYSPRHTALIPTDGPLYLESLNPAYVKVRRRWWQFWRTRPE